MIERAGQQGPQPPDGLPEAMVLMDSLDIEPIGWPGLRDSADMVHTGLMVCSTDYIDWRWLLSCLQSIIFGPACGC